jgi:hypothetical protein
MKKYLLCAVLILTLGSNLAQTDENSAKVSTDLSGMRSGRSDSGHHYSLSWSRIEYDGRNIEKWIGGDSYSPPRYVEAGAINNGIEVVLLE